MDSCFDLHITKVGLRRSAACLRGEGTWILELFCVAAPVHLRFANELLPGWRRMTETKGARVLTVAVVLLMGACEGRAPASIAERLDELPVLTLAEEWRAGSFDDPDEGFSSIGSVDVDSEGNIYVIERRAAEIRVLGPMGNQERVVGGRGEGPGEFGRPAELGILADTLWVNDHGLRRITLFGLDGSVLSTFPTPPSGVLRPTSEGVAPVPDAGVLRADGFVHIEGWSGVAFLGGGRAPPDSIEVPVLRFNREAELVDTVGVVSLYLVEAEDEEDEEVGGISRPPQTDLLADPGPPADTPLRFRVAGGIIEVDRSVREDGEEPTFSVVRVGAQGDTLYQRVFKYDPLAFTETFVDSIVAARGSIEFPVHQPPVSAAQVGSDGTVWLRREADTTHRYRWIILRSDGTALGQVDLPETSSIRWISEDLIYAVELDEFDVPWLVRYRVDDRYDSGGVPSEKGTMWGVGVTLNVLGNERGMMGSSWLGEPVLQRVGHSRWPWVELAWTGRREPES